MSGYCDNREDLFMGEGPGKLEVEMFLTADIDRLEHHFGDERPGAVCNQVALEVEIGLSFFRLVPSFAVGVFEVVFERYFGEMGDMAEPGEQTVTDHRSAIEFPLPVVVRIVFNAGDQVVIVEVRTQFQGAGRRDFFADFREVHIYFSPKLVYGELR